MADQRENILSRHLEVCKGVSGIIAGSRNELDVTGLRRPAVIMQDGSEQMSSAPPTLRYSQLQMMELAPTTIVLVRADSGAEAGALLTQYRNRIVPAILTDATLRSYVGTSGKILFSGLTIVPPEAEGKERRMEIDIVYTYEFLLSDLAEAPPLVDNALLADDGTTPLLADDGTILLAA